MNQFKIEVVPAMTVESLKKENLTKEELLRKIKESCDEINKYAVAIGYLPCRGIQEELCTIDICATILAEED